ncbi:MAG: formylglycine-generating enzyme family protein [Candidatus Cloacimonetes bacterium]|jgi:formylglycine-generating enzyme required for sulfatase activity|nr:formylglycine-generating enzyme family protein [Candidatus Cloacimonadota bacterium]MDY0172429.1 SUMF1/EgtB/PvdO family nonheme iron enzyme [Candidatus Cloacimonadaceae bacterium]
MRRNIVALLLLFCSFSLFAETILQQSFESAATDSWSYTANPSPDAKRIWWGPTTEMMGGAIAQEGDTYWAGWDLDNVESTVTFATQTLQSGYTYQLSFWYFTKNLITTNDYCRYSLMYDTGTNWDNWVTVNNNSNAWTQVTVDIPANSNSLRLRLSSKFDGNTKYAHWDYITVGKTPNPSTAPVVSNVSAVQRSDGSKLVDIYYDVSDANGDLCDITLKVSDNDGASFDIIPSLANLSGDFGDDLSLGTDKHIVWDAGAESYTLEGDSYLYRIYADDGSTPPVPENFVYVPGGTFTMGDTRGGGYSSELPTHSVTLNSFYLGKYQVTQAEYAAVMGSNPASGYGVGANYPVYYVSWYSAMKYCNLRSLDEGLTPVYSISGSTNPTTWGTVPTSNNATWNAAICNWTANGYRLPTESEWEYAARGATNTPDYLYSGSDDLNAVGWYDGNNSPYGSKPVGSKAPNVLGLYDMSGNLYEWCWDWWDSSYYSSSPSSNPTGPNSGSVRVSRGGYWYYYAVFCRVAGRSGNSPYYSFYGIGFRLCRAGL